MTVGLRCEHLRGIQVSGVRHGFGVVAVVPVFDYRVKEVSKHLQGTNSRGEETMGENQTCVVPDLVSSMILNIRSYFTGVS